MPLSKTLTQRPPADAWVARCRQVTENGSASTPRCPGDAQIPGTTCRRLNPPRGRPTQPVKPSASGIRFKSVGNRAATVPLAGLQGQFRQPTAPGPGQGSARQGVPQQGV